MIRGKELEALLQEIDDYCKSNSIRSLENFETKLVEKADLLVAKKLR